MIFLYILGGILLLVLLLLSLRARITLIYKKEPGSPGESGVLAGLGPVKIRLFPKKQKKIRLRDFSAKKYKKMVERDRKARSAKSSKKKTKKTDEKKESPMNFKEIFPDDFGETVEFVCDILNKFGSRIRCDVIRLKLCVGMKDAAATAYTTFGVTVGVDALLSFIDKYATLRLKSPKEVSVTPDFENTEFSGDVHISFSIRVGSVIRAGSGVIAAFFRQLISKDK